MSDNTAAMRRLVHLIKEREEKFEGKRSYRRGLLGRGVAGERSSKVRGREMYRWVRNRQDQNQVWQALGADIPDIIGWPVLIAESEIDPTDLIIVRSDLEGLSALPGAGSGTGSVGGSVVGGHHEQHELHNWDMVNVNKGMIIPARIRPTQPTSWSILLEGDRTVFIGDKLIDLRQISGYEYAPIEGVRKEIYYNTGTSALPGQNWYYMAVLTDTPDLIFLTGVPTVYAGGLVVTGSKAEPADAAKYNGVPLAYIYIEATGTSIRYKNIDDLRPLMHFPGRRFASGTIIEDKGGFYTGSTVESALQEIGPHLSKVKVTYNDTTQGYLWDKLQEGAGVSLTKVNAGADEKIRISVTGSAGGGIANGPFILYDEVAAITTGIVIPSMQTHPDRIYTGTKVAWEFDDVTGPLPVWGTSVTHDSDQTLRSHYYSTHTLENNTENLGAWAYSYSGTFDAKIKLSVGGDMDFATTTDYSQFGFMVMNAAQTQRIMCQFTMQYNSTISNTAYEINSYSYESSTYTARGRIGFYSNNYIYFRIKRSSASDFQMYYSVDGVTWQYLGAVSMTFDSFVQFGLRARADVAAGATTRYLAVDWVRVQ